jgi:hypothetical protein
MVGGNFKMVGGNFILLKSENQNPYYSISHYFHSQVRLAKKTIDNICDPDDSDFDSDDDGVGPVQKPLPPSHFHRRNYYLQ